IYDRLQALAGRLIAFGSISDSLHFGLSEVDITVHSSKRVSIDNTAYSAAASMFLGTLAFSRLSHAENVFRHHLRERPDHIDRRADEDEIDHATRAEFGYTLRELVAFLNAMGDIAVDLRPTTPAIMEQETLISMVASQLGWNSEKILGCLSFFSLTARDTYMSPPRQCRTEDLYPWRFNREISYSRRPLLIRQRD